MSQTDLAPLASLDGEDGAEQLDRVLGRGLPSARPRRLVLVACSAEKAESYRRAEELYVSPLFRLAAAWAKRNGDSWAILSAKHGLLRPDTPTEPYDLSLEDLDLAGLARWADAVAWSPLLDRPEGDVGELVVLAGKLYLTFWDDLERRLPGRWKLVTPLAGMTIGLRLQWLRAAQGRAEAADREAGLVCGAEPGSFRAKPGPPPYGCVLAPGHEDRRHRDALGRAFSKSVKGVKP